MDSLNGDSHYRLPGFPIRTSAVLRLFAPTRSFSQLVTSFIGSQCQGIPPALLVAWPYVPHCFRLWFSVCFRLILSVKDWVEFLWELIFLLKTLPSFFWLLTNLYSHIVFSSFSLLRIFSSQGTIIAILFGLLVEIMRFELMTPCLQGRCSPNWAIPPCS